MTDFLYFLMMIIRNEARSQAVEYEASMIDVPGVGKTSSCLGDGELWQNTVWGIDDFVSQEKFDFKYVVHRDNTFRISDVGLFWIYAINQYAVC